MKFNYDKKNKNYSVEADVEKLVEKGMDNHEKNWKEKFTTKHQAKKELIELKHKNKMEVEEQKQKKKSWFERRAEQKERIKEMELEQKRLELEQQKNEKRRKTIIGVILIIIGVIAMLLGAFLGHASHDHNSPWYFVAILGGVPTFVGGWLVKEVYYPTEDNKKKK